MIYLKIILSVTIAILITLWLINIHFVKTDRLSAWDWNLNALGLPRGSVRAILALLFISTLIVCSLEGKEMPEMPEWAVGIAGAIVGFYFGAATNRPKEQRTLPIKYTKEARPPGEDTNENENI